MEAYEVVRVFVNKAVVPAEPKRRGNPGYGSLRAVRLMVYSRMVDYLKRHPEALRGLGSDESLTGPRWGVGGDVTLVSLERCSDGFLGLSGW